MMRRYIARFSAMTNLFREAIEKIAGFFTPNGAQALIKCAFDSTFALIQRSPVNSLIQVLAQAAINSVEGKVARAILVHSTAGKTREQVTLDGAHKVTLGTKARQSGTKDFSALAAGESIERPKFTRNRRRLDKDPQVDVQDVGQDVVQDVVQDAGQDAVQDVVQDVVDAMLLDDNTPEVIRGVDTEDEICNEDNADTGVTAAVPAILEVKNDAIFSVLHHFKMIRLASRCFRYIVQTRAQRGDEGIRKRRSMLVSRLTVSQRAEYDDTFKLINASGDGAISLLELKRVMESIGDTKSDDELKEMLSKGHDAMDDESVLTLQDFMGIMAETEFYHLFRDIFASLDTNDTGFVKNADLQRVLNGVRDLISDDRKSIIDVEDDDMLIDYEQFSRMLLGTALI
jgi:calmodulin